MWSRGREKQAIEALVAHLEHGAVDPARLAGVIGAAVGAAGCAVTVDGERFAWGAGGGAWWGATVEHGGEVQGELALTPEPAGPLSELVAALGPVLAAARSARQVERSSREADAAARELADGRWRAAAEMDLRRRDLERNLHDGVQHHLVVLRMSVALIEHALATGADDTARQRLDELGARLDATERLMISTASGILPVALVTDGLAAALRAELAQHEDVALDLDDALPRHPEAVESAVYFICLEAVNNSRKHAPGSSITVAVRDTAEGLWFETRDDGPGFGELPEHAGLHNLVTRAAAVGGTLRIRSAPGAGTAVTGLVPR
ncbi:histidine kinase [Saccharothrix sp. BKS2]|uniref:sensor histidine kinase n=1 Tax=Saccharothrix sp. BKS2 TaxID=3064400 RepID=UPI0039EC0152